MTSEEGQIFVTNDGGDTWETELVENQFGLMRGVYYTSAEQVYIAATPGAIYVSEDGGASWGFESPVDFDPSYYEVIFTDNGTGFVCGSGSSGGTILRKTPSPDAVESIEISKTTIFPNPTQDVFRLSSETDLTRSIAMIYDASGKLIQRSRVLNSEVSISSLCSGSYSIIVIDDKNRVLFSEVVMKD